MFMDRLDYNLGVLGSTPFFWFWMTLGLSGGLLFDFGTLHNAMAQMILVAGVAFRGLHLSQRHARGD